MESTLNLLEKELTDIFTLLIKNTLFFLNSSQQSLFMSFFHYAIFIIGIYIFLISPPKSIFRILIFILIFIATLMYFIFNRCLITSIEINLSNKKNGIQKFIEKYFGEQIEGNISSRVVLSSLSFILGYILLQDYGYLKYD